MDEHPIFQARTLNVLCGELQQHAVRVIENPLREADYKYHVRLEREDEKDRVPLATFNGSGAWSLGSLLQMGANVALTLDGGPHGVTPLPIVVLCGTEFFIDERLRQLRNVRNPHHYFDLDDPFAQ